MRSKPMRTVFLATLALAAASCSCGPDEGNDGPRVASLELRTELPSPDEAASCAKQAGTYICPRDASGTLTLVARDGSGTEVQVDPDKVAWRVDSTGPTVAMTASGTTASVTGKQDWFDTGGSEGSAVVTASYDGLEASLPIAVVMNASGSWLATLDLGFSYTLSLRQVGRAVVDTGSGYSGRVDNDALTLYVNGIDVSARFTSRTSVSGTYSGPDGLSGTLTCTKQ